MGLGNTPLYTTKDDIRTGSQYCSTFLLTSVGLLTLYYHRATDHITENSQHKDKGIIKRHGLREWAGKITAF